MFLCPDVEVRHRDCTRTPLVAVYGTLDTPEPAHVSRHRHACRRRLCGADVRWPSCPVV
ncbi:hypothetical protein RAN53_10755 [Halomonas sp. SSL-5]|uniref:hypothetical protein n=1 Tax=Halomonas sp. SSL-5 TaxID=3065855 RepID=UPI002739F296|nr:hypothetical protein [Halomonas sp. SSL-5]MDY7116829.1 hypothetical protein [Halomonas sp. SSL-5]